MIRTIRTLGYLTALAGLASCQSIPNMPTSIFSGADVPACPQLAPGPAPFTAPFPAECRSMNKTASGVRYIPITHGPQSAGAPSADATIVVHYEAFLASNGRLIDSSYARGESGVYQVSELIDGWAESVRLMNPGDEWLIFVPSSEAFGGDTLGDSIPPNSDLVYRLKLDGFMSALDLADAASSLEPGRPTANPAQTNSTSGVLDPSGPDMAAWQAYYPWNPDKPEVKTLESGVSYVVLERGDVSAETATASDKVLIHYEGRLAATSDFFDSSWSTGEPALFEAGRLIPGFTEALTLMRPGDRVLVHIPADQGYGDRGAGDDIPAGSDLMFQIVMLDIQPAE